MSALNYLQHQHQQEEKIMLPYLDFDTDSSLYNQQDHSLVMTDTPLATPPLQHSRKASISDQRPPTQSSETGSTAPVFLNKFKSISRSKSPNALRTTSALSSHPRLNINTSSGMADLPRTPTSGSMASGLSSASYSTQSQWSPEPPSPTSPPRLPRYKSSKKKKGGLLQRSFSPTPGSIGPLFKGSKVGNALNSPAEELDPTTIRKNRTRPRKNPQDLYDQYDDLFTDEEVSLDEHDSLNTSGLHIVSETDSGSDDGYPYNYPNELRKLKYSQKPWPETPRSPPRSVPSPSSSNPNLKSLSSSVSPFLLAKWKASHELDTPPQSKPPSVTDFHQSDSQLYPPILPPTPPPPPPPPKTDNILSRSMRIGRASPVPSDLQTHDPEFSMAFTGSQTEPPVLPQTPPRVSSKSKRVLSKQENSMIENKAGGLERINISSDDLSPSVSPLSENPTETPTAQNSVSNSETASSGSPHRIPRKRVGSSSKVEALNNLMSVAKEISAHVAGEETNKKPTESGYTPQMRILDVCDWDNEFAFTSFTDSIPTKPSCPDAIKEEIFNSTLPTVQDIMEETDTHFVEANSTTPEANEASKENDKLDSTHVQVFQNFLKSSGEKDAFIHRADRFDALQTQRICALNKGDHQSAPVKAVKNSEDKSSTSAKGITEHEVSEKMLPNMWALMSLRWITFGRLLVSPAHERLSAASRNKTPGNYSNSTGRERNRTRVLDLGGSPVGDWGWHCAYDYPKSKVYTVTTRSGSTDATSTTEGGIAAQQQKCRGPRNHRHISVSYLWRLPFPDNHFDVVSARTLFMALKIHRSSADMIVPLNIMDEYDLCLEECLRVLKPGGHLEFLLLDNDIINPGPLGTDLCAKFTNELVSNAYDPYPTRKWIQRLNKAGYGEMKRAWMFLPMAPQVKPKPPSKDDEYEVQPPQHQRSGSFSKIDLVKEEVRRKLEAWEDPGTVKGSTESVAPVTGLLGSYLWERWMLTISAEMETGSDWRPTLDTIGSVLDEGKDLKSGWRTMVGWAKKPLVTDPYTYRRTRADSGNSVSSAA